MGNLNSPRGKVAGVEARGSASIVKAQGPMAELRQGVDGARSLEEFFLDLVGAERSETPTLAWLRG